MGTFDTSVRALPACEFDPVPEGDETGLDALAMVALNLQHEAVTGPPGATLLLEVFQQRVQLTGPARKAGHDRDGLAASALLLALDADDAIGRKCRAGGRLSDARTDGLRPPLPSDAPALRPTIGGVDQT